MLVSSVFRPEVLKVRRLHPTPPRIPPRIPPRQPALPSAPSPALGCSEQLSHFSLGVCLRVRGGQWPAGPEPGRRARGWLAGHPLQFSDLKESPRNSILLTAKKLNQSRQSLRPARMLQAFVPRLPDGQPQPGPPPSPPQLPPGWAAGGGSPLLGSAHVSLPKQGQAPGGPSQSLSSPTL